MPSLDHRIETQAREQGETVETIRQAFVDRQPMGRLGKPEEIAALAVYLAGDELAYTTGQIFPLPTGGLRCKHPHVRDARCAFSDEASCYPRDHVYARAIMGGWPCVGRNAQSRR